LPPALRVRQRIARLLSRRRRITPGKKSLSDAFRHARDRAQSHAGHELRPEAALAHGLLQGTERRLGASPWIVERLKITWHG
jgi:hypothetical protein